MIDEDELAIQSEELHFENQILEACFDCDTNKAIYLVKEYIEFRKSNCKNF